MLMLELYFKKSEILILFLGFEGIAVPPALFYLLFCSSNCSFPCLKKVHCWCSSKLFLVLWKSHQNLWGHYICALVKSNWSCMFYSCFWFAHSAYMMLCFPDSQNVEFICNVLVVADQLLISRLKEICEVAIAEKRESFHTCLKG